MISAKVLDMSVYSAYPYVTKFLGSTKFLFLFIRIVLKTELRRDI